MNKEKLNTGQKALQINLDAKKYGTFAEIGAGQEVARWFFHVGKASGTVAKTISAYDMAVSDAIYGPAERYVSRKRLQAMLDLEFDLIVKRLEKTRGSKCTFFAYADTVATKQGPKPGMEEGQGWLGIKFQAHPLGDPSTIIIHVRLLDWETPHQQEAVGILGVNLIHGAFYQHADPTTLIGTLLDGLTSQRVEVDMIKFSGPAFTGVDNRLMALQLVEQWLTEAAMFTADGESVIPSELLYKKPVLLERGSFRPLTNPMLDMLERAQEQFVQESSLQGEQPVVMFEMTLRQLQIGDAIDHRDFLDRVDTLGALGKPVLISNFLRYHRLVSYLSRQTQKPIGLPIGLVRLRDVFDEKFYTDLPGGLMESLGQLFKNGAKLYVYPSLDKKTGKLFTVENLDVTPHLRHLYAHLVENKFIENIANYNADALKIYSSEVLAKIHAGDEALSKLIPAPIFEVIKAKKLFGWRQKQNHAKLLNAMSTIHLDVKKTYKLFIGGKFPRSESGRYLPAKSASGAQLDNFAHASRKDFRDAVVAARAATGGWSKASAYNRGQVLYRAAEMLQNRASELVNEIARSTNVNSAKAKREVTAAIDRLVHYAGWTDKYSQVFSSVNPVASSHFNFTTPEPTGVVVVLAPDEPSLLALVSLVAPVILSGNAAIVIPSEKFPLPAATFAEILATSDLPGGVVNILTGKRAELIPHIAGHMDVNAIVDGAGVPEISTALQAGTAINLKRYAKHELAPADWLKAEDPYWILDTVEFKTAWHPIGL